MCSKWEEIVHELPIRYRAEVFYMQRGRPGQYLDPKWKEKVAIQRDLIRDEGRHGDLHQKIDMPDAYGHGGSSDTANVGRNIIVI